MILTTFSEHWLKVFNWIAHCNREEGAHLMPLILADTGEEAVIRRVGGSPEMKKHLEDMGFTVGGAVTVLNTIGGNLIVKIKESRVAISKEMAQKIMV